MKNYEVHVPVTGCMRVHLVADSREEALQKANEIATNIHKDAAEEVIPNLISWMIDRTVCVTVIEKGEVDG